MTSQPNYSSSCFLCRLLMTPALLTSFFYKKKVINVTSLRSTTARRRWWWINFRLWKLHPWAVERKEVYEELSFYCRESGKEVEKRGKSFVCLIRKWECLHSHQDKLSIFLLLLFLPLSLLIPIDLDCNISPANFFLNRCRQWCFVLLGSPRRDYAGVGQKEKEKGERQRECGWFSKRTQFAVSTILPTLWIGLRMKRDFSRCTMNRKLNDKYLYSRNVPYEKELFLSLRFIVSEVQGEIIFNWIQVWILSEVLWVS